MKSKVGSAMGTVIAHVMVLLLVMCAAAMAAEPQVNQQSQKQPQLQLSEGERKGVEKINTAVGADNKMKAATEFIKKNAKSQIRNRVATYVAEEIVRVQNPQQIIALAQSYISTFNLPEEADLVKPALIDALLNTGKFDEGLNEGAQYLQRHPEDVPVLISIAWAGANQVQKQAGTPKLTQAANDASAKAVELMEADKRPQRMDEKTWAEYRNSWLPRLYQARGLMLYHGNLKSDAKDNLEKAAGLEPYDPSTLMMLVNITNEEYQDLAKKYQTEKKADILNKAIEKMDEVIDWLARAVGATEGNPQMQPTNQQLRENLQAYYSFRHEGKTEGMNELIEKYKKK